MTERFVLAIDGGGSGTRIGLYDEAGTLISEKSGEASNAFVLPVDEAAAYIADGINHLISGRAGTLALVVAGMSGARSKRLRETLARGICSRTNAERVIVTTDVHAHLLGNAGRHAAVAVVSGTGSSIAVLDAQGETTLLGGRGPILGDDGSAYHVAVTTLRALCRARDRDGESPPLLTELTRRVRSSHNADLVSWSARAEKKDVAALLDAIVSHAEQGDVLAVNCVETCLDSLAELVRYAVDRAQLGLKAPIFLVGGVFEHFSYCRTVFENQLRARGIENCVLLAPYMGHRAVYELTKLLPLPEQVPHVEMTPLTVAMSRDTLTGPIDDGEVPIDHLDTVYILERMFAEDRRTYAAAMTCRDELALLVNRVVIAFRHGGRLVYVGAGTSGRIGVLDASECPPTFGVPPGQVIGIIAGGDRALRESIEGAEDDVGLGRADIEAIDPPIGKHDLVVGIAASGTTPYTLAAVAAAKARGTSTALICCNPNAKADVDHLLVLQTGPEVLPGSTRLKAGTATKMVLNAITTASMALSGRVFEGYMVGVQPTNAKLRKRAARIIAALTGLDEESAAKRLAEAGNDVAAAVLMERLKLGADEAHALLDRTRGDVRAAIALFKSEDTA